MLCADARGVRRCRRPGPLLDRWIDQFSSNDFAEEISSKGIKAWAVGYEAASHHVDLLSERLAKVLSELKSL